MDKSQLIDLHDELNKYVAQSKAVLAALSCEGQCQHISDQYMAEAFWLVIDRLDDIHRITDRLYRYWRTSHEQ